MSYPGNPSLAADIQNRIQTAYRQSIESAMRGNREEALLGCDFVLRLDAQFDPARTLQQMLETERAPEAYAALLSGLGATPVAAMGATSGGLVSTFSRLLEARRFEELLGAAQAQSAAIAGDVKLRDLVAVAQARFEAEPFVKELLAGARRALGTGQFGDVATLLDKAQALDPSHPGLAEIERLRSSAPTAGVGLAIDWGSVPDLPAITRSPVVAAAPLGATETSFASLEPAVAPLDLPDIDFSMTSLPEFQSGFAVASPVDDDGSGDHGERVVALLDEGQSAFERNDYQSAIDSWSRIFLIDIDNQEAARRIEGARQLKAEKEREVEEIFHAGVARFDAGDWASARESFRHVMAVQPSYVLAREYLDKIDEREAGGDDGRRILPEMAPYAQPAPTATAPGMAPAATRGSRPSGEEILVPPDPDIRREAVKPAVGGFAVKARRGPRMSPVFFAIGGAVLVVLGVGGWFLATQWNRIFPNSGQEVAAPSSGGVVAAAKKAHAEGKQAAAVAQLRSIPPRDAVYAEAQSLISQWERLEKEKSATLPAEQSNARAQLYGQARAALSEGESLIARRLVAQAAQIAPLDGEWPALARELEAKLQPLSGELALVRDGEYEMAMNRLWRRHEAEPGNRDVTRLMVDTYYNLIVRDLQRGDVGKARSKVREARQIDRLDATLDRLEQFCLAYEKRPPDLLFRIYVKYLPLR